ncbi:uncharacterized protein G2W53_020095 [Senna tora]|uniref:Uncharacterized protein n=1 Tax=Senna tora TaxID=362788 RepID=A0A834TYA9_9FABA|nr:uncharacterized protein G2W53_020095 [Senna tora]
MEGKLVGKREEVSVEGREWTTCDLLAIRDTSPFVAVAAV